ncbi:type II secretion system F family protein [Paludibacterium yongneupense]|uniref:type II secretion system F family protein n=1 Tax=Paludibacterium yongneupense TaxID=400061 RepID=UPI000422A605|nr:type II secretion system F family protein [Paludibacterium yongneupense]
MMAGERFWRWRSRDGRGGELRASSAAVARARLKGQGIAIVELVRVIPAAPRLGRRELVQVTRELATLLRAGVSLLAAFDIVARGRRKPGAVRLFDAIREDLLAGLPLARALSRHPHQFDAVYCQMIAAGEAGGLLDHMLARLARRLEQVQAVRARLWAAALYPTLTLLVAVGMSAVILLYAVPAFTDLYASFGARLPAPTRLALRVSDCLLHVGWLLPAFVLGAATGWPVLLRRSAVLRLWRDRVILRVPLLGPVLAVTAQADLARTLSALLGAGVSLDVALGCAAAACGNAVFARAGGAMVDEVSHGRALHEAMRSSGVFAPVFVQLTVVGEESGTLEGMLETVADHFDEEAGIALATLTRLLEPALMAVLGGVLGALVLALYLPVFEIGQVVN